jgi:hypothetical protein
MIPKNVKAVSLRDMHPIQVQSLMDLVGMLLNLAAYTQDQEIIDDAEEFCDEMVKLFGGAGVKLTVEIDTGDNPNHDGSQSLH